MKKTKIIKQSKEEIPYFNDLVSFYNHVKARPPLDKDFDVREIDPEVLKAYDHIARPFRHAFYCISLFLEGDVILNAGFWETRLTKLALNFKTPCQVVSWTKSAVWLKEYFIVFTESFLLKHKSIAEIVFELPFLQLEKDIPFEIEPDEVELLTGLYKQILREYKSDNPDKFESIASYTHVLLIHARRLYKKYTEADTTVAEHIHQFDYSLIERFRALIRKKMREGDDDQQNRTVKYFAEQLFIHPNYLNAVVKRSTQKTAIAFIHEHILHEAKSLLNRPELNIKEISFKLGFSDPSHFNHFFKKQALITPALFRKQKHLSFSHNSL